MNALLVLFAARLPGEAFQPLLGGNSSFSLSLERARAFPGVGKTVLLAEEGGALPPLPAGVQVERQGAWTKKTALQAIAAHAAGFDLVYFAWADCPFLDPSLAGRIASRHLQYAAEYSYADGWPFGLAPEVLSPPTAAILAKIIDSGDGGGDASGNADDGGGTVEADMLFSVIQKDINAFDIETEISSVDLRCHRLSLRADSRRNLLLLRRFADAAGQAVPDAAAVEAIVASQPRLLRTLPNFFPVQVYGGCPQRCAVCPYPAASAADVVGRRDFMEAARFETLLDKIAAFAGDAVIDLSLWGELALHPQKMELIEAVLKRKELALVVETSGIGWKVPELERAAAAAASAASAATAAVAPRASPLPPLSWIVSLDAASPERYREIRGAGFAEAVECAKKLFALFPADSYVQAVRTVGAEDDIEQFYRSWKAAAPRDDAVIIQKYDDFCGSLAKKQASDLSPVSRQPCWHLMRDFPVLIDGAVPRCREELAAGGGILGNVWQEPLEDIWQRGENLYKEHCEKIYAGNCTGCDEYYTYNF